MVAESELAVLFSSLISYAIIVGSLSLKVPQIINILKSKSVEGISLMTYISETLVFSITIIYHFQKGYDIITYGEAYIILIQIYAVTFLLFSYNKMLSSIVVLLGIVSYFVLFFFLLGYPIPDAILDASQSFNIGLTIYSKLPQIYNNHMAGHVGQLSIITVFLSFGGSCARAFTTFTAIDDIIILSGYLIAAALNGVLFLQCLKSKFAPAKPAKGNKKSQ